MSVEVVVLSGILVAVISAVLTKLLTERGKVTEELCLERHDTCQALLLTKIDNVESKVDSLKKFNEKMFRDILANR